MNMWNFVILNIVYKYEIKALLLNEIISLDENALLSENTLLIDNIFLFDI